MCRIILSSCGLPGAAIFFHIISWTARFSVGGWGVEHNMKCMSFLFSIQHLSETFLILRRIERVFFVNLRKSSYSCQILMEHEFSRQIFGKRRSVEFLENPSSGRRVVPWGRANRQTDRNDEANIHFSRFYESASKSLTGFSQMINCFFEFLIHNTEIYLLLRGTYWPLYRLGSKLPYLGARVVTFVL
jgi:hypothetical protein